MDQYWLGILYRKPNIIGMNAGLAIINTVVVNYTFEFSLFAMNGTGSGTHEISVGYRLFREEHKGILKIKDYVR